MYVAYLGYHIYPIFRVICIQHNKGLVTKISGFGIEADCTDFNPASVSAMLLARKLAEINDIVL